MLQSTLNIEKKIYRQIVKGIGFYQKQMLRQPTLAEVKNFVRIMNENLVPISNFDEKVDHAVAKLEDLHVCCKLPGDLYALWDNNPMMLSQSFMHAQTRNVRFDLSEAHSHGLLPNLEVGGTENVHVQGLSFNSGVGNVAVLSERRKAGETIEMAEVGTFDENVGGGLPLDIADGNESVLSEALENVGESSGNRNVDKETISSNDYEAGSESSEHGVNQPVHDLNEDQYEDQGLHEPSSEEENNQAREDLNKDLNED